MSDTVTLVLSCCGQTDWFGDRRSMDERWPIARCPRHKGLHPLISDRAYKAPRKARSAADTKVGTFTSLFDR